MHDVVGVKDGNPFAGCRFDAEIARHIGTPAGDRLKRTHPPVAGGKACDQIPGAVRRSVVDNQHLQIIDGLLKRRADCAGDEILTIEYGDDHRDFYSHSAPLLICQVGNSSAETPTAGRARKRAGRRKSQRRSPKATVKRNYEAPRTNIISLSYKS